MITASIEQLQAVFSKWEEEYRKNPELFQSRFEVLAKDTDNYGEAAAAYFCDILESEKKGYTA